MNIDRRTMLALGAAAATSTLLPRRAEAAFTPRPDGWRRFSVTTRVDLPAGEAAQLWVPVPAYAAADWMMPGDTTFASSGTATRVDDPASGVALVHAAWEAGTGPRTLEVTSIVATQSRAQDFSATAPATLDPVEREMALAPTALIPTDGIVREYALSITGGVTGDLAKARAIYDWIVENTARNPETRGCGLGDVASMLHTGDLTGKCADLNALFVGLARAAGLPARDIYGLRVAPSAFGYKSLGAGSSDVTKAQHCRAEVFLETYGWVAADPADVRKVMLEEPPKNLSIDHPMVVDARAALFGSWEGNWIAWNTAHDVALPGSAGGPVEFLMYPQAEIGGKRLDPLDPKGFAYTIEATEIA